jgi:hypothetical protein
LKRIEKYKVRGFTIREPPCPALKTIDPHEYIEQLERISAFDVFAYEDINAGEFLHQSSYHVLLHIGNQFHAYHRTQLCTYLKGHTREDPEYGSLCELPHKQQIPHSILQILPYSDYSIISLKQVIGNLYDAEYYTTAQWAANTPARHYELQQFLGSFQNHSSSQSVRVIQVSDLSGLTESLFRDGVIR